MPPSRTLPNIAGSRSQTPCGLAAPLEHLPGAAAERTCHSGVRVVRPLLWARKWELQQLLNRYGHRWVEDATNWDPSYARNFIRQLPGMAPRTAAAACAYHCNSIASTPGPVLQPGSASVADPGLTQDIGTLNIVSDLLAVQQACASASMIAQQEAGIVLASCVFPPQEEPYGCIVDLQALEAAQRTAQRRVLSTILQVPNFLIGASWSSSNKFCRIKVTNVENIG